MSKKPIVIIGMGEMAGVFSRGFLRSGYPVYPVTRHMDIQQKAKMSYCPMTGSSIKLDKPTVISVWFEKKKGQDAKVIIPSPVYGPKSQLIKDALNAIDISSDQLDSEDQLLFELVVKNVYILTTNIAGLQTGGTVGELWQHHRDVADTVSREVILIQQALTGQTFDSDKLISAMVKAFEGDLEHKCMGRSAPSRLQRALQQAKKFGVSVEKMIDISAAANT